MAPHVLRSLLLVLTACTLTGIAAAQEQPAVTTNSAELTTDYRLTAEDVVRPAGLPEIGKWMLDPDGTPAHWLGEIVHGKALREPINVIILDTRPGSAEDARARLRAAAALAGYPVRLGHSSGYHGSIARQLYSQVSASEGHAFSDEPFVVDNNHGRIFGPYESPEGFLFIGAFSRESVRPFSNPKHQYVSFNRARDDFSERLDQRTEFKRVRFIDLKNALVADPEVTTGDHDGMAIFLQAQ